MRTRSGVVVRLCAAVAAAAVLLAGCTNNGGGPLPSGETASTATTTSPTAAGDSVIPPDALPFPEPAGTAFSAARRAALQAALDTVMHGWSGLDSVKGVSAAVVTPDGSWAGVFGADGAGVPLVSDAMAGIGSVTKTVTAAEVLSLAQAGLVDLNAPASKYLGHPLLHLNPTVRELLSHTSGIPEFDTGTAFDDAVFADGTRRWTPGRCFGPTRAISKIPRGPGPCPPVPADRC